VREWWNTGDLHYATPRDHLLEKLGLAQDATGRHKVGRGSAVFESRSPSQLSRTAGGAEIVRDAVKRAMADTGQTWTESPALVLRRGPYVIAAGLDVANETAPVTLKGRFILLFDAAQPFVHEYTVGPGTRGVLVDLDRYPKDHVGVVAAASRVTNQKVTDESVSFDAIGQADTNAVVTLLLPRAPKGVTMNGQPLEASATDYQDGVLRLRFPNRAETLRIAVAR
jgi:hypothetical protein